MATIPESARALLQSDAVAHMVTVRKDGSPQVSLAWVGLDGDDLLIATLSDQPKLKNLRRDPRVALSFQTDVINEYGLREYLVVEGRAEIEPGGAAALLQELAYTYIGPDVKFPPMPNPPPGFITRVRIERVVGVGPWSQGA